MKKLLIAGVDAPRLLPLLVPQVLRYCAAHLPAATSLSSLSAECIAIEMLVFLSRQPGTSQMTVPQLVSTFLTQALSTLLAPGHSRAALTDTAMLLWAVAALSRWLRLSVNYLDLLKKLSAVIPTLDAGVR